MTSSRSRDGLHWYVAHVSSCQEKRVAAELSHMGVEHYLPVRREMHRWSDRRKLVECLVIPRFIFIRCSDAERVAVMREDSRIRGFLSSEGKPSVVRDSEMETFRNMVERGGAALRISDAPLAPGDRVRVIDGPLAGMECELVSVGGGRCLAVRLGALGTATMDLETDTVERI